MTISKDLVVHCFRSYSREYLLRVERYKRDSWNNFERILSRGLVIIDPFQIDHLEGAYLLPSLRTILLGVSNRQFGQYQQTISSVIHLGHFIWWQSSQYNNCSGGYSEKLARSDRGLNVCSDSSSISSLSASKSSTGIVFGVGLRGEDCFLGESSREFRFGSLEGLLCCAHGHDMNVYGKGRDMSEAVVYRQWRSDDRWSACISNS